MLEEKYTL